MGFKLGGVVCDKCVIFTPYYSYMPKNIKWDYQIPSKWQKIENNDLLCSDCLRAMKIKKLLK